MARLQRLELGIQPMMWHPAEAALPRGSVRWVQGSSPVGQRLMAARACRGQAFEKHCWSGPDNRYIEGWRSCYSDEHYFPTLLAINDMDAVRRARLRARPLVAR